MLSLALVVYVAVAAARILLVWLNLRHLEREGLRIPPVLRGEIDSLRLAKANAYTRERTRFGIVRSTLSSLGLGGFLFAGGLGWYDAQIAGLTASFLGSSLLFVAGLMLASLLLEVPFQLYADFRVEARHGFNRQSPGLWWKDWLKSTLLSLLLTLAAAAGAFTLVQASPNYWWLWVSALLSATSLLITFLSPYLIEPLFHRMVPLEVEGLNEGIRALTERAGVQLGHVLKLDASRRSSHSNAYFTGLGRVKRVVLFDTLLEQMSHGQILAVLAHELGHWKKHHVLQRTLVAQGLLVLGSYLVFRFAPSEAVPSLVGLDSASFAARLLVLLLAGSLLMFPLTPAFSAWSRHDEREADHFAAAVHGQPGDLADALAKLGTENLANLHPHPLYAAFYYSHPPLLERISALRRLPSRPEPLAPR